MKRAGTNHSLNQLETRTTRSGRVYYDHSRLDGTGTPVPPSPVVEPRSRAPSDQTSVESIPRAWDADGILGQGDRKFGAWIPEVNTGFQVFPYPPNQIPKASYADPIVGKHAPTYFSEYVEKIVREHSKYDSSHHLSP